MPYTNTEARRQRARERYAVDPEVRRKALENAQRGRARRKKDDKRRYRLAQRERYKVAGLTVRGTAPKREKRQRSVPLTIDQLHDRQAVHNARDAWRYFLQVKASDAWMRAYYEASGKPWNNPRLSSAEKFAIRYRLDAAFAQRQRERTSERRFTCPAYGAQWQKQGSRWLRATQSDDGSFTAEVLKALRAERHCAYCHRYVACADRHIDHVMPLARGGTHSADNLVMACATCNRAKRDKLPLEWLILIAYHRAAGTTHPTQHVEGTGPARSPPQRGPCAMVRSHNAAVLWVLPEGSESGSSKLIRPLVAGGPLAFIHSGP